MNQHLKVICLRSFFSLFITKKLLYAHNSYLSFTFLTTLSGLKNIAEAELEVLFEALMGGLCDPDTNVRWTAVELLRVVLKREDERGYSHLGTKILHLAVPLARLR